MKIVAFFLKKVIKIFGGSENMLYICTRKSKGYGSVAQLNRVLDYGSSGSRFESWRSHKAVIERLPLLFFIYLFYIPMNTHCIADGTLRGQGGVVLSWVVVWRGDGCGVGYITKKRKISLPLFQCPGQDSNLHELMLTTPSK